MAETINLGIVGIKNMGEYDSQTNYEKLNVVTYQGSSYCALKDTTGNLPTNTEYWQLYAQKGDTGAQGPKPVKGVDYYTNEDKNEIEEDLADTISSTVSESVGSLVSATPLAASSISQMTDTTRIYVNTTDGHWYWYDGDSWEDGGVYQGTALNQDDEERLEKLEGEALIQTIPFSNDAYVTSSGVYTNSTTHKCTDLIPVSGFNRVRYTSYEGPSSSMVAYYDSNKNFISASSIAGEGHTVVSSASIPSSAKYLRVSNYTQQVINPVCVLYNDTGLAFNFDYIKDDISIYDKIKGQIVEIDAEINNESYIDRRGYPVPSSTSKSSDFIKVKGFDKIRYKLFLSSSNYTVAFYDINKEFLADVSIAGTGATDESVIDIPSSAYYVIFSNYKNNTSPYATLYNSNSLASKIEFNSILKGKKIGFLGDSITNGYKATLPFRTIIQNNTGCISVNYGINGSSLSTSGNNPACVRYADMADDLDYVCVLIGINDSTQMGDEDSMDTSTFYGALNTLILGLINKYPTKKIMFNTLLQKRNINVTNKNNAIRSRCAYYNIPCYELHDNSQLNPNIDIVNNTMFGEADGLHPNDLGHEMIANKIQKALESI